MSKNTIHVNEEQQRQIEEDRLHGLEMEKWFPTGHKFASRQEWIEAVKGYCEERDARRARGMFLA